MVQIKNNSSKNAARTIAANRYLQGEERETVEHKLIILKREIEHIIKKLTELNDFVFADPQKKEPPHIAHICKSHRLTHKPKFAKECNLSNAY